MGVLSSRVVLATAISAIFQGGVHAQDAGQTTDELAPVQVFGILPDRLEFVPGSTDVLSNEDLERRKPLSVNEAIREATGFNVVGEDTFGLAPNIGLRGLNPRRSARTLLLEDGMPIFLAPYGDPSAHYSTPLGRVDRIEFLKGSGQILYGPQSVGGMINFVTKPVPRKTEGNMRLSGGSDSYLGVELNAGTGGERGGIMVDLSRKQGDGIRENHDFQISDFALKAEYDLTSSQTITVKVARYEERSHISETGLGTVEYAENPFQAPTGNNDFFQLDRDIFQAIHQAKLGESAKLTTQVYYVDTFRQSFRQINQPENNGRSELSNCPAGVDNANLANANLCGGRSRPRDYQFYGFEPKLEFGHTAFGVPSTTIAGFRYHEEQIERRQFRGSTIATSFRGNADVFREEILADVQAMSYFLENTFYLGNWSVTPGLRYEDIDSERRINQAEGDPRNIVDDTSKSELLTGLGVTYTGLPQTTLFAGIHEGFAPPRPDRDLGEVTINGVDQFLTSTPDPEKSTNIEIGVRTDYFAGWSLEATAFNLDFDNLVIGPNAAGRFVNAGAATNRGVEFAALANLDQLLGTTQGVYAKLNWTHINKAEFDTSFTQSPGEVEGEDGYGFFTAGNRLPYAPKHIISANLGFDNKVWAARLGTTHVSKQFANSANTEVESLNGFEGLIPSYTLLNASFSYTPRKSTVSYFLNVENLADKEYLASRVNAKQAGRQRHAIAGVNISF